MPEVRKIFDYIAKNLISPEEHSKIFNEWEEEQVKQEKFKEIITKISNSVFNKLDPFI